MDVLSVLTWEGWVAPITTRGRQKSAYTSLHWRLKLTYHGSRRGPFRNESSWGSTHCPWWHPCWCSRVRPPRSLQCPCQPLIQSYIPARFFSIFFSIFFLHLQDKASWPDPRVRRKEIWQDSRSNQWPRGLLATSSCIGIAEATERPDSTSAAVDSFIFGERRVISHNVHVNCCSCVQSGQRKINIDDGGGNAGLFKGNRGRVIAARLLLVRLTM